MLHHVCALATRGLIAYANETPLKTALLYNAIDSLVSAIAGKRLMKGAGPGDWLPLAAGRIIGLLTASAVTALFYKVDWQVAVLSNASSLIVSMVVGLATTRPEFVLNVNLGKTVRTGFKPFDPTFLA